MALGSPTLPSSPGSVPGTPASPAPPTLPPTPPPVTSGAPAVQARSPIITRFDYSPGATASGGFLANSPASNVLLPRPQLTAIAAGGSVSFSVSLGQTATIGLIYFLNLVADVSATISVSAGSFSQTSAVYPNDENGYYDQAEFEGLGRPRFFVLPTPTQISVVDVTIQGSITPVQVGYIGICSIWQAPIGMQFGWGLTIKDLSDFARITFGSPYVTRHQQLRVLNMGWNFLIEGGVYANVADQVFAGASSPFQAAIISGKSRPIAGVPFPDDVANLERKSVAGYSNTDQSFTNPLFGTWNSTFQIEQM